VKRSGTVDMAGAALALFDACVPVIPYAASGAFLGREKLKLTRTEGDRPRVALVADGLGAVHGVTRTIEQLRDRGVPGYEVEVIGTDADVDRRLSSVADVEIPYYPGLSIGVPSLPVIVEVLAEGRYDLVHLCSPGPAGLSAWLLARVLELPVVGSYHTELAAYAGMRSGQPQLAALMAHALGALYGSCDAVLSPSPASDERLRALGIDGERIGRWERGVDLERFDPALRRRTIPAQRIDVLYAGRLTREKGVDLLADAFLTARRLEPRLHLLLAGGGPEEGALRARLGDSGTFLGWLEGDALPQAYADADLFLFASQTDTFGQVVLEAQASGLPVVAVDRGGPRSLIEHGENGLLARPDAGALAEAVLSVVQSPLLRERLRRGGRAAAAARSWNGSMQQLARGYDRALRRGRGRQTRDAA
jgi:glycosyltransferase involved in cell wall biosynthesis